MPSSGKAKGLATRGAPGGRKGQQHRAAIATSKTLGGMKPSSVASRRESWVQIVREEWDDKVRQIANQRPFWSSSPGTPPYEQADNCWKREIYHFVCRHLDDGNGKYLNSVIYEVDVPPRAPRFKENPFHVALYATREKISDKDQRWKVSRYGKQLVYARRHRIPAELLVGFLLQAGTPDQVCGRANDPDAFEPWRAEFLSRLKNPGGTPG